MREEVIKLDPRLLARAELAAQKLGVSLSAFLEFVVAEKVRPTQTRGQSFLSSKR